MDNKLKTVDAETLLSTPMSKTMFIVDGLISQGVNVISGASKIGKSWLMLWLGLQVAQGNSIWGLPTLQCDVLYLSLEDTQRRIKDRLYNLTDSAPDNLYFAVTSGLIGGGLEEQITDFLTEHPATKLVIIDTLQKVRDSKGSAGKAGRLQDLFHLSRDIRVIKDNAVQPGLTFLPAAHGHGLAAFTKEAEMIIRTFKGVVGVACGFHGTDQHIGFCRSVMEYRALFGHIIHSWPPRKQ